MENHIAQLLYEAAHQLDAHCQWEELQSRTREHYRTMAKALLDRFYIKPKCPLVVEGEINGKIEHVFCTYFKEKS
ncbi:MAG: hypothetical protein FWH27_03995 [Planctomycetaceae bacterium]|nr:hypothetical protein [Planctomycetaceae bacterium]